LFVGLVNKLKGVHLILEVMIKLREKGILYSLDIAGGTKEPKYLKMIEQTIQDNGLQSQVTLHGWVNQDKVRQLMETCSVFILPSSQECLPVSVAEAMAAERVVVASDTGGIPEMIKDKVSGFLFVKNDTDQLAGILSYLYNNFEEIKRVAANARVKALEMFCPESVAIQTFNFYNKVRDSA
jgi:glycosyltransferase involved in cell wall biosynthesis